MKNLERSTRTNADNATILGTNRAHLAHHDAEFANSMLEQLASHNNLSEKQWYWVDVLAGRCISVAKEYGERTGKCMFCRRKLTDDRSVAVGYGPVCADNHHLPWGEVA